MVKLEQIIEKYISLAILALFGVMIVTVIYWKFYQTPHNIHFQEVAQEQLISQPGKQLNITRVYCSDREFSTIVKRSLRDGIRYGLDDNPTKLQKGCYKRVVQFTVPYALRPGYYVYDAYIVYDLNPIRQEVVQLPPIQFLVANPNGTVPTFLESNANKLATASESDGYVTVQDVPVPPDYHMQQTPLK